MSSARTEQRRYAIVREFFEFCFDFVNSSFRLARGSRVTRRNPDAGNRFQVAALLNDAVLSRLRWHSDFTLRPSQLALRVTWYQSFNLVEAFLWMIVAGVIATRVRRENNQQCFAVVLGCIAFVVFGVSDLLEVSHEAAIPAWLWGMKIACGAAILSARYTWVGWSKFRWNDREFLFGLALLAATIAVIAIQ